MSYTDQDVCDGRRMMNDGRENRLVIGDKLLSVAASGQDGVLDQFCDEISLNPRTALQYRHTARICTPPVRQLVADSGVHVSYSVLREGARLTSAGKPYDEGYRILRSLLAEAIETGAGRISVAQYKRALGIGPALQDLLDPSAETSVADYLRVLSQGDPVERDKVLRELVEEDDAFRNALKAAMDDKRRRDREGRIETPGQRPTKAQALARDLVRLRDQATALMNRYPPSTTLDFTAEQHAACQEALGTMEVLATWVRVRVDSPAAAVPPARSESRTLVAV
jgi:hypothetical protein